jgi:hypothetical protein
MKDKKTLQKVIEKAEKNGFDFHKWKVELHHGRDVIDLDNEHEAKSILLLGQINTLIFNHDFAKAFWGEYYETSEINQLEKRLGTAKWQYHLQQMVLEKKPLKYLEKFL